jgi:hypothetical protein
MTFGDRLTPVGVIGHHIVGRVEAQAAPRGQPAGDRRFAGPAAAAEPIDVPEPMAERFIHGR